MPFETFGDSYGSVKFGWVAAHVLYIRFDGSISGDLGKRFARRFVTTIGDVAGVRVFIDSSGVSSYDVEAFSVLFGAMLTKRSQYQLIISRPWAGVVGRNAVIFAESLGCVEYVTTAEGFYSRLEAAAPHITEMATAYAQLVHRMHAAENASEAAHHRSEDLALCSFPPLISGGLPFDRRR